MLNNQDKKYLRGLAQEQSALIQIGKAGLSVNLYESIDLALEAHELIKVSLLKTAPIDAREAAIECAANTHSEVVHIVGRTFVLYRRSKENKLGLKK
ncbi:hypothetical protein C815_00439 [Firmicutes bacterium M10-2]|nr:hypothetical protein C815_00439 [Firmicutes bacterium M10-2]